MDKINFIAKDDFPVSTDTLNRLQEATSMVANMALLGGTNYILSGCVVAGSKAAPGVIVLSGEILPFIGGDIKSHISIQETKITLDAFDDKYPEAYINRVAVFADDGVCKWDDLKQVLSNKQLQEKIEDIKSENPGFVKMWSGAVNRLDEKKYLLCDGRTLNTADYPDLAYYYGKENEATFKIPDLRKRFIVGYDNSVEDYNEIGKTGGEAKHVLTVDELPAHKHIVPWGENLNTAWRPDWGYPDDKFNNSRGYKAETDNDNTWPYTSPTGENAAHENRPPFYVLAFVIRVNY